MNFSLVFGTLVKICLTNQYLVQLQISIRYTYYILYLLYSTMLVNCIYPDCIIELSLHHKLKYIIIMFVSIHFI